MAWWLIVLIVIGILLLGVAIHDVTQKRHAILRNFPIIGHLRYLIEAVGPELRQYIVADNDEERPFSRDQRRVVYATAKQENTYFGFGTDNDIDRDGYLIIKHAAFPITTPIDNKATLPSAKVMGEWRDRPHKFRPKSFVNLSAMSYGSLSAPAVEAINRGCLISGAMHNTGEGGISDHHRHGADLMFQFGTGYFGCRDANGNFDLDRLVESVNSANVKCIEVKLSQGAKPGLGGVLPGKKVTPEIAKARGVEVGETVHSPNAHTAFGDVDGLIDFVESIAAATGIPVGIKSAVGQIGFWTELTERMNARAEGPDFVAIDGGEGGTGAAPLAFSDHVALPFRMGFARVWREFAEADLHQHVTFIGMGKLGFSSEALVASTLGCDMIGVAREAMLAIGCIQAQECHAGHCPTGIATHGSWLTRGLDPTDKSVRLANYLTGLRSDITKLSYACGAVHPTLVKRDAVELIDEPYGSMPLAERYGFIGEDNRLSAGQAADLAEIMRAQATLAVTTAR
jgi:glutamate synthase domain-containing protein 2